MQSLELRQEKPQPQEVFKPLNAELNFHCPRYSAYLISRLAFFLVSFNYNRCVELRGKTSNQLAAFFLLEHFEKITYSKIYESKVKMQQSNFNLKRNINPNKTEKKALK